MLSVDVPIKEFLEVRRLEMMAVILVEADSSAFDDVHPVLVALSSDVVDNPFSSPVDGEVAAGHLLQCFDVLSFLWIVGFRCR